MTESTNRADLFSRDLVRELKRIAPEYCWEKNGHAFGNVRNTVDALGVRGGAPLIFVEAELRRGNPESNVTKIWQLADADGNRCDFILIQGFSSYYDAGSPAVHKETAIFLGQQMSKCLGSERAEYFHLPVAYRPGPEKGLTPVKGAGRRAHHARELASKVLTVIRSRELGERGVSAGT